MLFQYKADLIIISLKIILFSPWYSWTIADLELNNNHSLTINKMKCEIFVESPKLLCLAMALHTV
jgi:hypothetical protein